MKIKQLLVASTAICIVLALVGCGAESSVDATTASASDSFGYVDNVSDAAVTTTQEDQSEAVSDNDGASDADQETSLETVSENTEDEAGAALTEEYPSTDEILSAIDAEESKLYWCAETPDYSGSIDIQPVEVLDEESFSEQLSEILGSGYTVAKDAEASGVITISSEEAAPDMETVLSALSQLTGADYTEIEPEEIYEAEYVLSWNGYSVDAEGFFYTGERAGEAVVGSYVGVSANGKITVHNPLILSSTTETIDTASLVSPETVETICRAYYESQIGPYIAIITDITLGYYYSESEESLLPAWQCDMIFFRDATGHNDSILMDAQTGELLRK